jgi:hypothetical protein
MPVGYDFIPSTRPSDIMIETVIPVNAEHKLEILKMSQMRFEFFVDVGSVGIDKEFDIGFALIYTLL